MFQLSADLLHQALHMPTDVEIIWIGDWDYMKTVLVVVEGSDFPEVPEGSEIPLVTPSITEKQRIWDWNLPAPFVNRQGTW